MPPFSRRVLLSLIVLLSMMAFPLTLAPGVRGDSAFEPTGELDCNGHSPVQAPLAPNLVCVQATGANGIFEDNGAYVGHDEPTIRFMSEAPGTGNSVTYALALPIDNSSSGGIPSYQDYITFWLGMALCDNNSYPQQPCINDSDLNTGLGVRPTDAGSAAMELQFYPPGFPNFAQAVSCDNTHWCVALTIDSLECSLFFQFCNPRCIEPVNFAFLTSDGVPIGPPSPQLATLATFDVPANPNVFLMSPGDVVQATLHDTPGGLLALVTDLTTGVSGSMLAGAANGFMNTDLRTCMGTPYSFHPEYSSAAADNQVPWTALQFGIALDVETGHFEFKDTAQDGRFGDDTYCLAGPTGSPVCLSTDFDFDGVPYQPAGWPTSTRATPHHAMPVTILPTLSGMIGPNSNGAGYPTFELETEIGFVLAEFTSCNLRVPNSCGLPNAQLIPTYGGFYPFYSVTNCRVVFGDMTGHGATDFGGDAGYDGTVPSYIGIVTVYGTSGAFYTNAC